MKSKNRRAVIVVRRSRPTPAMYQPGGDDLGWNGVAAAIALIAPSQEASIAKDVRHRLTSQSRLLKAALDAEPHEAGKYFSNPKMPSAEPRGSLQHEVALHEAEPGHMKSNASQWVHGWLNKWSSQNPGKKITPDAVTRAAEGSRLFPKAEVRTVLGSHGLDAQTPVHPQDFLDAIGTTKPERITMRVLNIPGHTMRPPSGSDWTGTGLGNLHFISDEDHLKAMYPDNKLGTVSDERTYRVLLMHAPHTLGLGHWPYKAAHDRYTRENNPHLAVAHARGYTTVDPKTGKRYFSLTEIQSDALQNGLGKLKYKTDDRGQKITDSWGRAKTETIPQETAIGNADDWHKAIMNAVIAYAMETGHDGIELASPSVMNGVWVRPEHRMEAMHRHYGVRIPEHVKDIASQFDAPFEYQPYWMDFKKPDALMGGPLDEYDARDYENALRDKRFANTLKIVAAKQGIDINPGDLFGTSVHQLPEHLITSKTPDWDQEIMSGNQLARLARENDITDVDGYSMQANDLMGMLPFYKTLHHGYHLHASNYKRPVLPSRSEIASLSDEERAKHDPELLHMASVAPQVYDQIRSGPDDMPVIVKPRLTFTPAMREYHDRYGFGLWGVSGPKQDQRIANHISPPKKTVEKPVEKPTAQEWPLIRTEADRLGIPVNEVLASGYLAKLRSGGS